MKNLAEFTNQYQVSKTLRFELIPQGKTLEHIQKNGIIETDTSLAASYKCMKETIDEFHKDFIERALSNVSLKGLADFYDLYTATAEVKSAKDYKKRFASVKDTLRKEVVAYFKNDATFEILDKKDLIQKELSKWIDTNNPGLYYDSDFHNFTTYFTGYNQNRMNMYSDEEKSTAVAYRLVDENLPKFMDNIRIFDSVKCSEVAESFSNVYHDMKPWVNYDSLEDMFSLKAYNSVLTQSQIDAYNTIIGGVKDGDVKLKGLNEYINLFNQTHPDKKLPKLKMLYKQILSDRVSASWLPEAFTNVQELLDGVAHFAYACAENSLFENIREVILDVPNRNDDGVYIRNDTSISDVSNRLFGYYGVFYDALGIDPESKKKEDYYPVSVLQSALDRHVISFDVSCREQMFATYSNSCVASYFSRYIDDYLTTINISFEAIKNTISVARTPNCALSQEEKDLIKAYLDSVMQLLHFVKPLYLKPDSELDRDEVFYSVFTPLYEQLRGIIKLYDMVRNYVTKKPYSTEKIKLNFECSTLLDGWDVNKETQNLGVLLLKDKQYYLGIMDKDSNKSFTSIPDCIEDECYQKVIYKLLPGPNKMLPKVFFSKSRIEEFAPSEEILKIYEKGSFKKGADFDISDCRKLIDFFKASIEKHPEWRHFEFSFSPTASYSDISEFYREISEQGYKLTYKPVSCAYVDSLVDEGKLYLFKIYNKDFSEYSRGKPNLHTMYWKALFTEQNLADVAYKLNGEAEVFYRKKSISEKNKVVHPKKQPIAAKNPNLGNKQCVFNYELTKDRRYTMDKFQLHVPITMNFKAAGKSGFNDRVCSYLRNNPDINIIGIDRGERHLLYISMVDRNGNVVKDKNGRYIQYSLNTISGEYKDSKGKLVKFDTPYHKLLAAKEIARAQARESWGEIENIKELKSGYMSQVVSHIARLMVEYNAIVVMEELNSGFKNSRKKVERQVYQNFEKALIEKLNYLVFKDYPADEVGGLYHALQLSDKFDSFKKLTKQSGFIFYVPAWNTSKIDPVTGFVDFLKPKYKSVKEAIAFFSKFDSIRFNAEKDWFEFAFDYSRFTDKAKGTRTKWTICTFGDFRYAYNRTINGGHGGYEKWNVSEKLKKLFADFNIDTEVSELIPAITSQTSVEFFKTLIKCLQVTLSLRYSPEDTKDFILSPIADANGEFYCSEGRSDGLPQDGDANGAFNIARKGLMVLEQIDKSEKYTDWTTKISNKDWLSFVQTRLG